MNKKINIFELTYNELLQALKSRFGRGTYHASAIFREILQKGNSNFYLAEEFYNSPQLANDIKHVLNLRLPEIIHVQQEGGLIKSVTLLIDGYEIETVIVPMATHKTLCISSQVGCRMGCRFCETARVGFKRNLTVQEIVGQVYLARFHFKENIRNVVFMGMGEPLDNIDNVAQAIRVISDQRGFNIAKKNITVSTAGLVDGINKIASLNWPDLNLAISLNASNNDIRSQIMPVNTMWPMNQLQRALLDYPLRKKGALFFEYILMKDFNDSHLHAKELALYLKPLKAKLNIIPYNPCTKTFYKQPSNDDVERFRSWLVEEKIFVRKRAAKGTNIMAACGQLGNQDHRWRLSGNSIAKIL
ncbi:MAG: 23S rRNA (adenine(2503)-C(2))-methyltransferase RlmN [Desulfobacterales bacterium]|nr:23S rRNA (adenine(2503)-C(2))-methyltransferase RlmN [Desulfobacterales bacterium]